MLKIKFGLQLAKYLKKAAISSHSSYLSAPYFLPFHLSTPIYLINIFEFCNTHPHDIVNIHGVPDKLREKIQTLSINDFFLVPKCLLSCYCSLTSTDSEFPFQK